MAPTRRKGSARAAAAAAAARQQWKVGDLVLAKMKGFPAWPAVISDPKKWGYSSDRKKLLVFFFGTKQIAFCNYVDIEAFTEERKKTLLAKRQGKGADFVRAVEEIVDCYEKLQKQIHDSGDEGTVLDSSILEGSGHKISMGSEDNIPPIRACQSHDCDRQNNDVFNPDKNSISPSMNDAYCNLDSDMKHLTEKVPIIDQLRQTSFATTNSLAKKSRNTLSQNFVIQKRAPSLSRSRSSTSVDASKFQTAEMTVSKDDSMDISVESMGNNIEEADFAARNGLPNNAVDNSICNDIEKHISTGTLVSDGTHEDVGSGITTVESKSNLSRDDAFESKDERYIIASIDANNKVDCQADYQNTTLALKNNRKQDKGEITENMSTYGATDEISQFGIDKKASSTFNKINERVADADGDEHLPLVKRARARKGDLSLEENQSDVADKKTEKLSIEHHGKDGIDLPKNKHAVLNAHVNISPSSNCTKSKGDDMLLNDQSFHLRGSTVDAEAALPPSKRLHRALEAMSANAAKARDDTDALDIPEISNECLDLSEAITHDTTNSTLRKPVELHKQNNNETVILTLSPRSSACPVTVTEEPIREMTSDAKASSFNRNLHHEEYTKISTIDRSPICSVSAETMKEEDLIQTPQPSLTESSDKTALSTSEKSLSTVEGESEMLQQKKCCFKDTVNQFPSQHGYKMEGEDRSFLPDIPKMNVEKHSALFLDDMPLTIPVSGCPMSNVASGSIKPSISLSKEKYEERDMKQDNVEIKHLHTPKDLVFSPDSTPMKVLISTTQAKQHYSHSSSLSGSVIDTKLASDAMSSLSPFLPEDSSEHMSGHSERTNCQLSCSRSPDANSHQKNSTHKSEVNGFRLKSLSVHEQKGSNTFSGTAEASAALRSFEALVCTLTRAKESISRATHYAIECAKHDAAGEVVDILLRNLEKEPSLHRRVDMFFLVDSITRFCRGQKGVAGDNYPSIFQTVLGRMLSAAAPSGNAAMENRRQCLKVLRLWLERKTLPEPIVHHHIRAIESLNECSLNNGFSRRPSRTERAVDDPVREMEGMLDEYGSNACFQLPGLLNSHVFEETGGSDSDDKSFEAVTPEHPLKFHGDKESIMNPKTEKHKHILEDVDGELEMEDVAPSSATEINSSHPAVEAGAQPYSHHQFEQHNVLSFAPPLPDDRPPTTPPLPSSPPPLILPYPSPSAIQLLPTTSKKPADFTTSHSYVGTNSMQNHLAHPNARPIEQNATSMSSDVVPYYAPGYRDLSNHMLHPSSSVGSSCAYMSNNASSRLSINHGIANLPSGGESSSNKAYHLQPPPPTVSNQFSYVQSEQQRQQQQQRQSWGKCSSQSDKFLQLGHDQQAGNPYGDGRGMVPNESCGFSATVPSGHIHSEKIEMSSSSFPFYGGHPETPPMTNQCWSHPPRPPSYQYPVRPSRPLENHLPRTNGAPAYWRPR